MLHLETSTGIFDSYEASQIVGQGHHKLVLVDLLDYTKQKLSHLKPFKRKHDDLVVLHPLVDACCKATFLWPRLFFCRFHQSASRSMETVFAPKDYSSLDSELHALDSEELVHLLLHSIPQQCRPHFRVAKFLRAVKGILAPEERCTHYWGQGFWRCYQPWRIHCHIHSMPCISSDCAPGWMSSVQFPCFCNSSQDIFEVLFHLNWSLRTRMTYFRQRTLRLFPMFYN